MPKLIKFIRAMSVVVLWTVVGCDGGSDNTQASRQGSVVLTGQLDQIPESYGIVVWGDSLNKLCQQWSLALFDQSGWFYGTGTPSASSANVYVLAAPQDPLAVIAAENFEYTGASVHAQEGDTVFFRGRNGFFGAWTIREIEGARNGVLSGRWYFKAGGGGDFTGTLENGGTATYDTSTDFCDGF
jgi:hypothetical protein